MLYVIEKMWIFFSKFYLLQYLQKLLLGALAKNEQLQFSRSHLYKRMYIMVLIFWIPPSRQIGYKLEIILIIWNCRTKIGPTKK